VIALLKAGVVTDRSVTALRGRFAALDLDDLERIVGELEAGPKERACRRAWWLHRL
jgi:hypothetical protein